jgi:metal-dependent amidase/aminoacylase/carboxypeptidase family protein
MQITMKNATATAANDVASSGDEVKMLLQGRKQFENMTLGKAGHCVVDNAVQLPNSGSGNSSSWLDEEMKSIQWPAGPCTTTVSSAWKETVNSFFQSTADNSTTLQDSIKSQSASIEPFLISIRRLLHRYPELMYQEKMTSQIVQRVLTEMGITNFTTGWAKNIHSKYYEPNTGTVKEEVEEVNDGEVNDGGGHGIVVDIGSGQEPCILLRADMDALPIVEQTPLPPEFKNNNSNKNAFHSNHHGKMHACGHDSHMTMLLGATYLFKSLQEKNEGGYPFPGTIRVIFQPAEEGGAGAKRMVEEGVLTNSPKVKYAFGMHVWPTLLSGEVGFRSGKLYRLSLDNLSISRR